MKIHAVSDLHLEFGDIELPEIDRDVLVLAGDIGVGKGALDFIQKETKKSPVIYVLGNHEFYNHEYRDILSFWLNLELENLYVLENRTVELHGVRFLGATLWTDMNKGFWPAIQECQAMMNDYHAIRLDGAILSAQDTIQMHNQSLHWLEHELPKADQHRTIVITHHAPSRRSVHRRFRGSLLNAAFYSDLDWLIKKHSPRYWIHGHTHDSFNYRIGRTRVVCNPRGYREVEENPKFKPELILKI